MKYDFWELEEHVGQLWDRIIFRASSQTYPEQAVYLEDIRKRLGIVFRAMGGDRSLSVEASTATEHRARRNWLQAISGKQDRVQLSWQDNRSLFLPECIDVFPDKSLNQKLYIWLTAISSLDKQLACPWLEYNQRLSSDTLKRYPGLKGDYEKLISAHIQQRPNIKGLPADEALQEEVIQQALLDPFRNLKLPIASKPPQPVCLWLHPSPPASDDSIVHHEDFDDQSAINSRKDDKQRKRMAKREQTSSKKDQGLLAIRFENIFSWGDFINLDRSSEDENDLDTASQAAEDMDTLHIVQDQRSISSALKFDLDLPSAANDDLPLGEGILRQEWNYKKSEYIKDYCCVQEMISLVNDNTSLPEHLKKTARKLRAQFESLTPSRVWYKAQTDGVEIDIDAYNSFITDRLRGSGEMTANLYQNLRAHHRDLSCLLLADLSLSTDSWINNNSRVIDIIRESLFLMSETLANSGDRLAIHGFSSRNRNHVRYNIIKGFDEKYNDDVRSRIHAIKPGFYTRMGAAIRHASDHLENSPSSQKLLLIITDGKPNDLDLYEGRYGIEDTRMAIMEAHKKGIQPFCVTIDEKAGDYLPYIFGEGHYIVIRKVIELPKKLPLLYARLTQPI